MNTIGVSNPAFSNVPFDEMLNDVSQYFSHWEIFSEMRHYAPDLRRDYSEAIGESKLTFSLHTGISDINVGATNETIRTAAVNNIAEEMKSAYDLGIGTVTVHPGLINVAVKETREKSVSQANKSMREIEKTAGEYGLDACIENMPKFPLALGIDADELERILDGTDLPVCFDIGHAHTSGQIDRMADIFGDRIRNVHIHDNMGIKDDHMPIGDGTVDFDKVLGLLGNYSRAYIIEARSMESAVASKSRLEKLLAR